jgi:hypothetical protein
LPAQLSAAIAEAAAKYGVPADLLAGIWHDESGGTYPNPYVNPKSGAGGLFGTEAADYTAVGLAGLTPLTATTQQQADVAAGILATGLIQSGGNVAGALSYYTTGSTTIDKSYVSAVEGFIGGSPATAFSSSPSPQGTARADPSGSSNSASGGSSSVWGSILGGVESATGDVLSTAEGAAQGLWGDTLGAIEADIKAPLDFLKAAVWLVNPLTWLRAFEGLAGLGLVVGGVLVATGAAEKVTSELTTAAGAAA